MGIGYHYQPGIGLGDLNLNVNLNEFCYTESLLFFFQGVIRSTLYSGNRILWIAQNRMLPHSSRPWQQLLHRWWH